MLLNIMKMVLLTGHLIVSAAKTKWTVTEPSFFPYFKLDDTGTTPAEVPEQEFQLKNPLLLVRGKLRTPRFYELHNTFHIKKNINIPRKYRAGSSLKLKKRRKWTNPLVEFTLSTVPVVDTNCIEKEFRLKFLRKEFRRNGMNNVLLRRVVLGYVDPTTTRRTFSDHTRPQRGQIFVYGIELFAKATEFDSSSSFDSPSRQLKPCQIRLESGWKRYRGQI